MANTAQFAKTWSLVSKQEEKQVCISYEYTRVCPQNHGLYVKQFPEGTCAKDFEQKVWDSFTLAVLQFWFCLWKTTILDKKG